MEQPSTSNAINDQNTQGQYILGSSRQLNVQTNSVLGHTGTTIKQTVYIYSNLFCSYTSSNYFLMSY